MNPPEKKSFWALMVTQFFGAFNDNVLKVLIQLLIVQWVADKTLRGQLNAYTPIVFAAPFIIFSMFAGRVADRNSKSRVTVGVQFWQLFVILVATISLFEHHIPWMMASLFLLSMQAAFFSPAKYGILPELMGESELSNANGLLNSATFMAILIGTIVGSFLVDKLPVACGLLALSSLIGLVSSFQMEKIPAAKPNGPLAFNPFSDFLANWKLIGQDRTLKLSIIAVNYFWFMGAVLQTNVFLYGHDMMNASTKASGILLMAATVGIGLGSYLAGRLSTGKVELGLVPLGALGMSIFTIDMMWAYHSIYRALFDLFMMGMSGGIYEVPLNALVQWRAPASERGRVLATVNFLSFVAIEISGAVLWLMVTVFHLNPAQVLFTLGILSLIGTIVVYSVLPQSVWRFILFVFVNLFYRIRVTGSSQIPTKGPALLIANHLSLVDGFLIGGAMTRTVRFMVWRSYYEDKRFHWLMKTMKAIPLADSDSPKVIMASLLQARKALEEGDIVCIFAEGEVSRTGNLGEFKKGFEVIVKDMDVPVIPVHLDRVWGSIFSFERGRVLFKKPHKIPYPVTVTFGAPMPAPVNAATAHQAVMDLGAQDFQLRLEDMGSLPMQFLRTAKKQPRAFALADTTGRKISYGMLASVSSVMARTLAPLIGTEEHVGVLVPPTVGGAMLNVALSMMGRVPVNLNYTAGAKTIDLALQKAGIKTVIASRKLLEKVALPPPAGTIYIEDIAGTLSKKTILKERVIFAFSSARRFAARANPRPMTLQSTASIMFSSGSTGIPKGVVLTHSNLLSNCMALSQAFDLNKKDCMVGVLPFFHSFGFTATLWFPLVTGFSAVYHVNPLDARAIGELTKKYKATLLLATPTFLMAYARKCTYDQFQYLRFVITGAERLRESVASDFKAKFGKEILEGYGCTELSPVAACNVPDVSVGGVHQQGNKPGTIGQPIPGVTVRVVDPATYELLPTGQRGLLLVKGPNVMKEYLGEPEKTREVIRDGWYVTGDIAEIDPEGFIHLVDRLSRFSKIGGEMVPHLILEEKLQELSGATDPMFAVTAVPDEKRGEKLIVLYLEKPPSGGASINIDEVYKKLQGSGLANLWIPDRNAFFPLEALPYLGTGKLDLGKVKELAKEKSAAKPPTT